MPQNPQQSFSEEKHAHNDWNTAVVHTRNPLVRAAIGFCSAKRRGVNDLAHQVAPNSLVLDAGAGNCAYGVWFASQAKSTVVCTDISFLALHKYASVNIRGKILRVCADLASLPFKQECFDAIYTIDTLGHIPNVNKVLDEFYRSAKKESALFCHSECTDPQAKWPDRVLISKLGADVVAAQDGHVAQLLARDLFMLYSRRFQVISFVNPAGYLGWILGYPHKYLPAFKQAKMTRWLPLLTVAAALRRMPVIGIVIVFVNAITNHLETFFGFTGGGSCFGFMKKQG
jgi:SAM-dependent methyltransferase